MKKLITFSIFVILATLLLASPVLATPGKGAVKGEVTAVDPGDGTVTTVTTLTIKTKRGEIVTVTVPQEFDIKAITVGDEVLVKGAAGPGDSIKAEWIKQVGKGRGKGDDQDKPEGKKENSAFCAQGKQEKLHPLAAKVGDRFEAVDEDWVMETFCDGFSMGAIMLALKTSELEGSTPEELLERRAEGEGWGQIWKDKDLIGSEKEGHSPPGLLNRPDHAGPKVKDD
jgi:hypothetical protein